MFFFLVSWGRVLLPHPSLLFSFQKVGLFRKSGVKSRIQALRQMNESAEDNVNYEGQSAYDVADMLKQYFRDLPEPLMTNKLSETFLQIYQCKRSWFFLRQLMSGSMGPTEAHSLFVCHPFVEKNLHADLLESYSVCVCVCVCVCNRFTVSLLNRLRRSFMTYCMLLAEGLCVAHMKY